MWVELRDTPLSVDEVVSHVARAEAGGIDVFIGVVRNHADGRAVTRLEYEAYRPMAVGEMTRIAEAIERDIPEVRVSVAHRLGSLVVGDLAIVCAASAPHRGEAFAACQRLIDEIKHSVPIFKREHGPEGVAWVGWVDARCGHDGHGGHTA